MAAAGTHPSPTRSWRSIKKAGGEAIANGEDVSDWNGAKAMIDAAIKAFGKLDILINNAGILRDRMLTNMEEGEWDAVINVHLKGTFAPSRHAAAYWRDESKRIGGPVKGRIINTSSTSGIYGNVGQTNYGAAKAGIAAFTIIAARELRRYGVTVNAISPSAQTRMTEGLRELTPEQRASRDPRWVSPTVVYLASEEAQDITGRVIQAGFGRIAVCEGWRRGAEVGQVEDPATAGRARARDDRQGAQELAAWTGWSSIETHRAAAGAHGPSLDRGQSALPRRPGASAHFGEVEPTGQVAMGDRAIRRDGDRA